MPYIETPAEEDERLLRLSAEHDAEVARRVAELEDAGEGDVLHGILAVLLDPNIADYSLEQRKNDIVQSVLARMALQTMKGNA